MKFFPLISGLLILLILVAGCSDESGSDTVVPATTTLQEAKYISGDIVAKTETQAEPLWLILGYNQKTDTYERIFILRNPDGSWGYRMDERIDTFPRAEMEKLYPVRISHVTASSIPVSAPAGPETAATETTTVATSGPAPEITSITPDSGASESAVTITGLAGKNFVTGATVKLIGPSPDPITADLVRTIDTKITCVFNLKDAPTGKYSLMVTNPDGKSATLTDAFTVTTPGPVISGISPYIGTIGDSVSLSISGTNFKNPAKVYFVQNGAGLEAANVKVMSSAEITCVLTIPQGTSSGPWDVIVRNIADQQNSTAVKKFYISNPA